MSEEAPAYVTSTRPDPAVDMVGYLRWIGDKLERIEAERLSRRVSATEAARILGFSESYLRGHPWRIPGFGARGNLHSLAEYERWLSRPDEDRQAEWDALGFRKKRHIMGSRYDL